MANTSAIKLWRYSEEINARDRLGFIKVLPGRLNTAKFSAVSDTIGKISDNTMESKIWSDSSISLLLAVVVNIIACPFTVLLNVLVIVAVRSRPSLRTMSNILLACLALTDALTGLILQPSFILWGTFQLLGETKHNIARFRIISSRALFVCSVLHLTLVTCERLLAIKYTMRYPYIVTTRNIKVAVIAVWLLTVVSAALGLIFQYNEVAKVLALLDTLVYASSLLFIVCTYVILYREMLRHREKIKSQQLPQEEVRRVEKDNRALKTTMLVVGAVILCFLPIPFLILLVFVLKWNMNLVLRPIFPTLVMLNSLFNPLIYCWRQKEMRQFVFRFSPCAATVSAPHN